mmetsp:Transcript_74983/g.199981  ORF Transcript_74983/g.199981 Transcript_74983/m.199981 type:complete len:87 (+) Transcript_74983:1700-1960(+)
MSSRTLQRIAPSSTTQRHEAPSNAAQSKNRQHQTCESTELGAAHGARRHNSESWISACCGTCGANAYLALVSVCKSLLQGFDAVCM